MTYSTEQQTQIIKMKSEGKSSRKIANELGLSKSGVNDFLARVTKETEYLMQGENGKRLNESIKQLATRQVPTLILPPEYMSTDASDAQKSVYKASVEFMNTHWGEGSLFTEKQKDLLAEVTDIKLEGGSPLNRYMGTLGEACSGQEYSKDLFGENFALGDMLTHANPSQVKIVNHVDDCRKAYVEKREEPLMKIVTSPLRVGGKTHMYIGDSQVKPDISFEYLRCKGEYIVEKKPDVIICGGDFADMPSLSSYDKGKGKAEGKRVKKDIEAAIKGMQTLLKPLYDFQQKQLKEFGFIGYKPRMVLTIGNHESRLTRYTNDNPELLDFISIDSLKYKEQGWEVYDFLEPVLVDGITYIHYLPNEFTGKAQGGNALKVLADFGGSITQGHKQILTVATRFAPATGQQTWFLQAGACYDHNEEYKGLYNNNHFRGLIMKYNLDGKGNYDLHTVSLKYIMDKYSWL